MPVEPDLRSLRAFLILAEELSFTRTAERLHLASSALSVTIARLENQLGTRLFDRGPRHVRLTDSGRVLLEEITAPVRNLDQALERARERLGGSAPLRIGHPSSLGVAVVPAIVAAFAARGVAVVGREMPVVEQLSELRAGALDAVLLWMVPTLASLHDLTTELLDERPTYVAVAASHPLAGRARAALSELAGDPWILPEAARSRAYRDHQLARLAAAGVDPLIAADAATVAGQLGLVARGVGVTFAAPWTGTMGTGVSLVAIEGLTSAIQIARRPGTAAEVVEIARRALREAAEQLA